MKEIPLSQGRVALVDDEDFDRLRIFKWFAAQVRNSHLCYAVRRLPKGSKRQQISMHRELVQATSNRFVDHKNGNGLDNRKTNLRICRSGQNVSNSKLWKTNHSGYRGVSWKKDRKKWAVEITHNWKQITLGDFTSRHVAALVYDLWALDLRGEFARTNFTPIESCKEHFRKAA